jgi:hypothetical protein
MSRKASWSINAAINVAILALCLVAAALLTSGIRKGCSGPVDPTRATDAGGLVGEIIQLEVLNGCGKDGLASEMQRYLRGRGFDVVDTGNHVHFGVEKTLVIDRLGNDHAALQIAKALGLDSDAISTEPKPELYLDASVIVGCDYASIPPYSMK